MSGHSRKWSWGLLLPILTLAATVVQADQANSYRVDGSNGVSLWGMGNQPGTQAVAFAFDAAAPMTPGTADPPAAAEPRVAFLVTQWAVVNHEWVQQQWYGDWPLAPNALAIATDLGSGTLNTLVMGTLVERHMNGSEFRRVVFGQLNLKWMGSSSVSNSSAAYTYQTPSYTTTLQTAGSGRMAMTSGTIAVDGLGAPISLWGVGSLSAVTSGMLNVSMR
jgi:hypothetical protein